MPTPVAKGIIIGVAALVAAGIAVYESPQFRRWMNSSRRKLATVLHDLGDGVDPGEATSPFQHDISMMEEVGPAAEERRRIAREELERRRIILEKRQKKRSNSSLGTFDTLVDADGRLLDTQDQGSSLGNSTGVDLGTGQTVQRSKHTDSLPVESTYEAEPVSERGQLQISPPEPRSRASSVCYASFTPVSEESDGMSELMVSQESVDEKRLSSASSSHTAGSLPEVIYAHPDSVPNGTAEDARSPFSDLEGLRIPHDRPETPPTPSTAENFSHIAVDASSDGTLSEFDGSLGRAHTPASWSEVGSEVSSEEYHQHGL
ncbi:uncharacterized protein BJX67DRAFT_382833 [Aspergillus lucknowensis]|uniref:Uncharacterized protein n=1 Tax=Aspergillus lucknowensis TaxID=176173 RepID=A0ABR4LLC3_9EURO